MKKISDTLREIIQKNSLLQFGFSHHLFNLSELARFLQPHIEARSQKEVRVSAITMNLSRLQKKVKKITPDIQKFEIENLMVYSDLSIMTFQKTSKIHTEIQKLYTIVQEKKGFMTLTEGGHEITIILENEFCKIAQNMISESPKQKNHSIASIGIKFSEKYSSVPGFVYSVLQQTTLQGINIVELSSTYTELILYIDTKDVKLAFDTIFECFSR